MERADLEHWKAREVARLLALVETERRYYQEIAASIPVGLLVLSTDLAIVSANRAIRTIFGLRSGDSVRGRLDTPLPDWVLDRVQEVLRTGVAQTGIRVDTEHKPKRRLRVGILPIRSWDDEAGREALLSIEDLTSVTGAGGTAMSSVAEGPAPAVEASAMPASKLIENLDAIVWAVEPPHMNFLFVSRHAEKMLGFPVDHWTGNPTFWADRVSPADRESVAQSYRHAIERGEPHVCEFRAATAGGSTRWLRESARLITRSGGRPPYLIGVTVDITERRELEDQRVQAERVEAVSRLAGRVAHELNNMLMILTGYSEELLNSIPAGNALRAEVQQILSATERMGGLTGHLLAFSRRPPAVVNTVELEAVLSAIEPRLRSLLGEASQLEFKLSRESSHVRADTGQLEQIVTSIVQGACQIVHGPGRITIETSRIQIMEDLRRASAPLRPGSYAVITIAHTGHAFEGEAGTSLFETVLPGKDAADEAAASVARAYGILRQWGGDISGSSGPAEGSVLRVFLECVEAPVLKETEPAVPERERPEAKPQLETILVVEDEAGIRDLVRKILRRQGYTVLEAANGDEALAVYAAHAGIIDLLITDMMMPEMGGRELADRLRAQLPDVRVLYVSGYTDDAAIYAGNFPPGTAFLEKPFTLGSLLHKVKEVLSAKVG